MIVVSIAVWFMVFLTISIVEIVKIRKEQLKDENSPPGKKIKQWIEENEKYCYAIQRELLKELKRKYGEVYCLESVWRRLYENYIMIESLKEFEEKIVNKELLTNKNVLLMMNLRFELYVYTPKTRKK